MTVTAEYSYVGMFDWFDGELPKHRPVRRNRIVGRLVSAAPEPEALSFPNTEVLVADEPVICQDDPDAWFPDGIRTKSEADRIARYCSMCWMRVPCREYGLAHPNEAGIWGGLSQSERRKRTTH